MTPGEPVRDYYRAQGKLDERNRIIELITNTQVINPDQKYFLLKVIKGEK
jgi:hypothetical protein